ncbi:MAG TPA: hypothetical protein VLW85_05200 [Myxococcales bacterium]|nr:hypothetical protein [Myxococcales bacterium]
MSRCPPREQVDDFALHGGELASHVASCPRCAARAGWVQREAEVVRKWAAQDDAAVAELWGGVQSRIRAARRRWWLAGGVAVAAAAALAVVFLRPARETEATESATLAIESAEVQYRRAAEVLEVEAEARARTPEQRTAIAQARRSLVRARSAGAHDAAARIRVLEGYAAYLRSLRRALRDGQ